MQNVIINILGDMVHKKIWDEGTKAGALSILVNERKNCYKMGQNVNVIRYIDNKAIAVQERFLSFVEALVLCKMLQVSPHLSLIHCMRMNWLPK